MVHDVLRTAGAHNQTAEYVSFADKETGAGDVLMSIF